jgi:hypothetical protein
MAGYGANSEGLRRSPVLFLAYWLVFLVIFLVTVWMAIIDFRYIRMEYALAKKEIFKQTLGEEALRKSLREATRATEPESKNRLN